MNSFSRSGGGDQRQFFPVSTDRVWAALTAVLGEPGLKVKSTDDMLMRAEVSTGMTAMTWGANFIVQVEPAQQDGSSLAITAASKFPAARDRARIMKVGNDIVKRVSVQLQS